MQRLFLRCRPARRRLDQAADGRVVMRLNDLVEVESHANVDVPCAGWGLKDQFLKGRPHEELPIPRRTWSG